MIVKISVLWEENDRKPYFAVLMMLPIDVLYATQGYICILYNFIKMGIQFMYYLYLFFFFNGNKFTMFWISVSEIWLFKKITE